ncbi:MAG: EAL domain-containing protein [Pseudomonadota bacterium]
MAAPEFEMVNLIAVYQVSDELELAVQALKNKGIATRSKLVDGETQFVQAISSGMWDAILLSAENDTLSLDATYEILKKSNKDIPIILVTSMYEQSQMLDALERGVTDVAICGNGDYRHLLLVIERELKNVRNRHQRRKLDMLLRESEKRCDTLIENSKEAIIFVADGIIILTNPAVIEMLGISNSEDIDSAPLLDWIVVDEREKLRDFIRICSEKLSHGEVLETQLKKADGSAINVRLIASFATHQGEVCLQIIIQTDLEKADLNDKLKNLGNEDVVTGLYTKYYFIDQVDLAIERALVEFKGSILAFIKIKNFDEIEQSLGLAAMDFVIANIASSLRQHFDPETILAKFATDSFALLYEEDNSENAFKKMQGLHTTFMNHLIEYEQRSITANLAIGLVPINESAADTNAMLSRAKAAMEEVSKSNKDHVKLHVLAGKNATATTNEVTGQLRRAMRDGMFKILFQPIISLNGENQPFYEVLLRMINASGEDVSPYVFLDVARSQHLISKIDRWVIVQSLKVLVSQLAQGKKPRLIINVLSQTLIEETFLTWFSSAIKVSNLPHGSVIFQLTESDTKLQVKQLAPIFKSLSELNCLLSISRFGGSANPFAILQYLHVDFLKFDSIFSRSLQGEDTKKQLKEIIAESHENGKRVIISFVEDPAILSTLYMLGANYVQGYYLQPPAPEMNYDFSMDN